MTIMKELNNNLTLPAININITGLQEFTLDSDMTELKVVLVCDGTKRIKLGLFYSE